MLGSAGQLSDLALSSGFVEGLGVRSAFLTGLLLRLDSAVGLGDILELFPDFVELVLEGDVVGEF